MFELFYRLTCYTGPNKRETYHSTEAEAEAYRLKCTTASRWDIKHVAIAPEYISTFQRYADENRRKAA
jgi:hypothetical protein